MPVKFAILYTLANLLFIGRYALTRCTTCIVHPQKPGKSIQEMLTAFMAMQHHVLDGAIGSVQEDV